VALLLGWSYLQRFEHLSPALVEEMRKKIFRPVLRKVRLFDIDSKVPLAFVDALAMCITSNPFSPSDTIVPRGAYGNALCIVLTGQVVISRSGVKRRLILSDDGQPIFGVSATLDEREFHSAQSELEEWSAESISYCDIAKIEHDAFKLAQAQTWPEGEQVMRRVARAELLRSDGVKMTNALGDKVRSTVWVGNIPGRYATESRVKQLMGPFGVIQSATVRQKSGKNKSWAFVTFESPDSATRALEAEIDVYGETDGNGKQLYLKVKEADLQNALSKGGAASKGGAIAAVLVKHATESHDYAQHAPTEEHTEEAVTPASSRRAITKTTESVPELPSASDSVGSADTDDEPIGAAYLTDQLISSMPLFEGLTPAERGALAQVLQTVSYPDGYAIVNQGDIGQTMFVLAVGTAVATMTVDVSAPPQQLKFYKSGDYFGELALMSNQPRSATVSAQGAVTCFTIERAQFQTLSFSQRFLEVLQKGAERSFRPTLTKSPSSTRLTPPPTTGKRNVSLVDVKKMRRQQPSVDAAMNSSQDIVAMLLSTGSTGSGTDGASVQPPVALDVNTRVAAHSHQLTASRLEQLQERQDGLSTQVEAVSRSVAELKDEMAARFDRLEAALSASLPPQSAAGQQQQQQQQQREESA
jgi:CRP-like cAMP-binding protein